MRAAAVLLLAGLLAAGCSEAGVAPDARPSPSTTTSLSIPASPPETTAEPEPEPERQRPVRPRDFEGAQAAAVVRFLAGEIGPRHGTSAAFREAADWVRGFFDRLGYDVTRQAFDVPGGDSWGVPVAAGESVNVVAVPDAFDPGRPHLVVGAHLDTVPQAPGAEDNGSGVGVMLAAAAVAAEHRTRLPVVWVAFGAEEPRGPSDDDHHYGSRAYVAAMTPREREAMRGMVSLDRVGVGETLPVGSASDSDPVQQALLAAGRRAAVPVLADPQQRSSDHWSFVRDGLPAARLGSTPYAGYHSPADVPSVVQPDQLTRTGRVVLAWLSPGRGD